MLAAEVMNWLAEKPGFESLKGKSSYTRTDFEKLEQYLLGGDRDHAFKEKDRKKDIFGYASGQSFYRFYTGNLKELDDTGVAAQVLAAIALRKRFGDAFYIQISYTENASPRPAQKYFELYTRILKQEQFIASVNNTGNEALLYAPGKLYKRYKFTAFISCFLAAVYLCICILGNISISQTTRNAYFKRKKSDDVYVHARLEIHKTPLTFLNNTFNVKAYNFFAKDTLGNEPDTSIWLQGKLLFQPEANFWKLELRANDRSRGDIAGYIHPNNPNDNLFATTQSDFWATNLGISAHKTSGRNLNTGTTAYIVYFPRTNMIPDPKVLLDSLNAHQRSAPNPHIRLDNPN